MWPPVNHGVVTQYEDQAAFAVSIDPSLFQKKFDEVEAELAPLFACRESRAHAVAYVRGPPACRARAAGRADRARRANPCVSGVMLALSGCLGRGRRPRRGPPPRHTSFDRQRGAGLRRDRPGEEGHRRGRTPARLARSATRWSRCSVPTPVPRGHCLFDGVLYV